MSILDDHRRFREIVKGRVKEDLRKYLTNKEFIGKREKEYIKIPIPHIDIPRFRYGKNTPQVGQGDGAEGEPTSDKDGSQSGKQAGDAWGEHELEIDVLFSDFLDWMGEALELPRLQPKGGSEVQEKASFKGVSLAGPRGLKIFKSVYKNALARMISAGLYDYINPKIIPVREDFRYKFLKKISIPTTRAVIFYIMDISGSMGEQQKEIVRITSFWISSWIRKNYKNIDCRFIVHDAQAKEVNEHDFFRLSEAGGTLISSAYELLLKIMNEHYDSSWNIYIFQFSDGDNWNQADNQKCISLLSERILSRVNLFGYGQVESQYGSGQFLGELTKHLKDKLFKILRVSQLHSKEDAFSAIKTFLGKNP